MLKQKNDLLEEQRRSREKPVAEQEARAARILGNVKQQAEADAARKAAAEYAAINARRAAS